MSDLSTTYLGLQLRNPIVVGSSGLTGSLTKLQELEEKGAGAVVLKSLFGEDIERETAQVLAEARAAGHDDPDTLDTLDLQIQGQRLDETMALVAKAKKQLSIPVIASINCTYAHEWKLFARHLAGAGADALQMNLFVLPADLERSREEQEQGYVDVVKRVVDHVKVPVALKIGTYFTSLGATIQKLSQTGIAGLVLFNRSYHIDFDIERMRVVSSNRFSHPNEYTVPLRWISIMANRVGCDLAASSGIHTGEAVVKQLLAGAKAVEMVSAIYQNGTDHIQTVLAELDRWMTSHEYYEIGQFQGAMAQSESGNPAVYERAQFLKTYGERLILTACAPPDPRLPAPGTWSTPTAAGVPEAWGFPLDVPLVVGENGMIATDRPLATTAGVKVLCSGGNAVDAAVATAFVMTVVNPAMADLGGGGFMVAHMDGTAVALDFRPTAPAEATRSMYLGAQAQLTDQSLTGHLAVGVPGLVAGLWKAHRRFGTTPWAELVAPAIRLAERGFVPDSALLGFIADESARLARFPASAELFLPDGQGPRAGMVWQNADMATTLQRIADQGVAGFYAGQTADLMVAEMRRGGGIITHSDLQNYEAKWREPIQFAYRGYRIVSMPPPASGGTALAVMANILEGFDLGAFGWHSPAALHLTAEAMRRAYSVRNSVLGDPDFVEIPLGRLLSKEYAAELRAGISRDQATPSAAVLQDAGHGGMHTTHISIADRDGNGVALTSSIGGAFGSAVSVTGAGFALNNLMDDFAAKPGSPNRCGLVMGNANAIAPGKRPLSSMTPTIVVGKDGRPFLVSGAAGGSRITTAVFNVLSNVLDYGLNVSAAVRAPRIHHQHQPDTLFVEAHGFSVDQVNGLQNLGHVVQEGYSIPGFAPSIMRPGSTWIGGADPRAGGAAQGY